MNIRIPNKFDVEQVLTLVKDFIHSANLNNQIKDINKHQLDFDKQYLPDLLESLNYQENLKKSLPVVLRAHHRYIKNIDG